eukprot:6197078-Prymnesium_polylepis.2
MNDGSSAVASRLAGGCGGAMLLCPLGGGAEQPVPRVILCTRIAEPELSTKVKLRGVESASLNTRKASLQLCAVGDSRLQARPAQSV